MDLVKPGHRGPFCERVQGPTISHHLCSMRRHTCAKVSPEHGPYDHHRVRQCPAAWYQCRVAGHINGSRAPWPCIFLLRVTSLPGEGVWLARVHGETGVVSGTRATRILLG